MRASALEEQAGLDKLFFDLASESRLGILMELRTQGLRMQEIGRKLDLTNTETSRQLPRLSEALMIQRQPDGVYSVTNFGKLILEFFPAFEFIQKHREYFTTHDYRKLPHPFISRLGEISKGELKTELAETVNRVEDMFNSSEEHVWVMTTQTVHTSASHSQAMTERLQRGVKYRALVHERLIESPLSQSLTGKNVEKRSLLEIPGTVVITEKEACISLFLLDGKVDYSTFFGSDSTFMNWAKDLFNYFWGKGRQVYPL